MNLHSTSSRMLLESIQNRAPINDTDMLKVIQESDQHKKEYVDQNIQAYTEAFGESYSALGKLGAALLKEDVEIARQVSMNNLKESLVNESTSMVYLTTSVVTTLRKPMEASLHRAWDTQAATSSIITMETMRTTLENANNDVVDAYNAFDDNTFLDTVETKLTVGTTGINPGSKNVDLLTSHSKNVHRIDTSARIAGIEYKESGTAVTADKIKPKRGYTPYFDNKTGMLEMVYEVQKTSSTVDIRVTAKIDYLKGILEFVSADEATSGADGTTKVFFDFYLAHDSHQNAISVGVTNKFDSIPIPTGAHFEVSDTIEKLEDIKNNESGMKGVDFISRLSELMVNISATKEDLVLHTAMKDPTTIGWEEHYDYAAPDRYAMGSPFEWIKLNFVNMVDLVCTDIKAKYHVKNAVFRIVVSPILLRIIDNGYTLGTDESVQSVLNYSVTAKTAANTMIFISSERYDDEGRINMILTDRENPIIKTFDYWKYQSFLTDALQSSKNPTRKAVVFSERNKPISVEPASCQIKIANMPHKISSGNRFKRLV